MKTYKVTDIEWCVDYDYELSYLPTTDYVMAYDEDDIADRLANKYGFLVYGFSVEVVS